MEKVVSVYWYNLADCYTNRDALDTAQCFACEIARVENVSWQLSALGLASIRCGGCLSEIFDKASLLRSLSCFVHHSHHHDTLSHHLSSRY